MISTKLWSALPQTREHFGAVQSGGCSSYGWQGGGVPDTKHPWVNTTPEKFESDLQLLKTEGCKVVLCDEFEGKNVATPCEVTSWRFEV